MRAYLYEFMCLLVFKTSKKNSARFFFKLWNLKEAEGRYGEKHPTKDFFYSKTSRRDISDLQFYSRSSPNNQSSSCDVQIIALSFIPQEPCEVSLFHFFLFVSASQLLWKSCGLFQVAAAAAGGEEVTCWHV